MKLSGNNCRGAETGNEQEVVNCHFDKFCSVAMKEMNEMSNAQQ
jgi:hypothetical protein